MPIKNIFARQIFDSCGIPTVEVDLTTDLGLFRAAVPSGNSAGVNEALELRDEDKTNYLGKSVFRAIENINNVIAPELLRQNLEVTQQSEIDDFMIQLDGTDNKSKLGTNAILPVSLATAKAGAAKRGIPLYRHLADLADNKNLILPVPAFNVISGGTHAGNKLAIQEFMILPTGANSFKEAMKMGSEVYQQIKTAIKTKYGVDATNVGNRGAFCPKINGGLAKIKEAFLIIKNAIKKTGYDGRFGIAIDVSATSFYKKGKYDMDFKNPKSDKNKFLTSEKLMASYMTFIKDYPVVSIEDPFANVDAKSWIAFTEKTNIQVVGDDLILTNPNLIEEAMEKKSCNCFLLKLNQLGTVTETIEAHLLAKANGWGTMVADRMGETEDTFIADLCVGLSTGQIKTGAPCRSERLSKYNQLLRIEEELGSRAKYAGTAFRRPS